MTTPPETPGRTRWHWLQHRCPRVEPRRGVTDVVRVTSGRAEALLLARSILSALARHPGSETVEFHVYGDLGDDPEEE